MARHVARRRRRWPWAVVPVVVLLVAAVAWVAVRGLIARQELLSAEALVRELQASALEMDFAAVPAAFSRIEEHTGRARELTDDPVWRLGELVPVLGTNLTVVRELAALTDDVIASTAPLAEFAGTLENGIAPVDGVIPLAPFDAVVPHIVSAVDGLAPIESRLDAIDSTRALEPVAEAHERIAGLVERLLPVLRTAGEVVPLVPGLLGGDGAQEYVVMFQNNAETRSLGGTALSFAWLTIDEGRLDLRETVPAGFGNFPVFGESPVPVPDGFEEIYPSQFGRFVPNATQRPSFPTAGAIVAANWREARGLDPDAVVSIDAVALGYLLRAIGEVPLSTGDVLTADTVVPILLNEVLQRYDSGDLLADNLQQDLVYGEAVAATFERLSTGAFDMPTLLASVIQGFTEERLSLWSPDPAVTAVLEGYDLANDIPRTTADVDGFGIYVNDHVGAKLNYFLSAELAVGTAVCDGRRAVRLEYDLSSGLQPDAVASTSPSILGNYELEGLEPGVQRLMIFGYAPPGSRILAASVDGEPIEVVPLHDEDNPVLRAIVSVPPGGTVRLALDVELPGSGGSAVDVDVTPLVAPTPQSSRPLDCASLTG